MNSAVNNTTQIWYDLIMQHFSGNGMDLETDLFCSHRDVQCFGKQAYVILECSLHNNDTTSCFGRTIPLGMTEIQPFIRDAFEKH